ncbi:hypothetical protein NQ317_013337 [Molorchus minor]|uniref:Endonuclease/exonuclease/phosphatase domain-containing protein n=1 Tax=Molorchus minor TaxID=1323400 RepID=A0ABQ9K0A8_9CUCU|nr:hypothetical protein NQ317_013337 [Molorchus minor]
MPDINNFPGLSWKCTICIKNEGETQINLGLMLRKLNDIQADISLVKKKQDDMVNSLEFFGGKIDDFAKKIDEFETKIKPIPSMQAKINDHSKDIITLHSQVNNLQQQMRMNNLEINEKNIIESCHRVPHINSENKSPKSIIVKLITRALKEAVLAAVRREKGIAADKIGFNIDNNKIYINDHLTPLNQLLFKKTRDFCRGKNVNCWTRDCKIYLKYPPKTQEFYIAMLSSIAEIICMTETWLNSNVNSAELFDLNKYNDRDHLLGNKKDGGGVLIAIKKQFQAIHRTNWSCEGICEDLWVSIKVGNSTQLHLCCVYVPPHASVENLIAHLHSVSEVRQRHENDYVLIVGDYNVSDITWENPDNCKDFYKALNTADRFGESLVDAYNYLELRRYNGMRNENGKILDLVFSSIDKVSVNCCSNPFVPEDKHHPSIEINININHDSFNLKQKNPFYKLSFSRANYEVINNELDKINWDIELTGLNAENSVTVFYNFIKNIITTYVQRKKVSNEYPLWFSNYSKVLLKEKVKLHKRWKKFSNDKQLKLSIKNDYKNYISNIEHNLKNSVKGFWSFVFNKNRSKSVPKFVQFEDKLASTDTDICEAFSNYFASFQDDITRFHEYCVVNKLFLNIDKCHYITFSRLYVNVQFSYYINNSQLKELNSKLTFELHIESICHKAYRNLGFIMRVTKSFTNFKSIIILHNSLVRSHLEYASVIWNPFYMKYIERIERIQIKFVNSLNYKFNRNLHYTSYDESIRHYKILKLSSRRTIAYILLLYKIFNNNIDSNFIAANLAFNVKHHVTRNKHKKLNELEAFIGKHIGIEIVFITEYWLSNTELGHVHLDHFYIAPQTCRKDSCGGGSMIFFKKYSKEH